MKKILRSRDSDIGVSCGWASFERGWLGFVDIVTEASRWIGGSRCVNRGRVVWGRIEVFREVVVGKGLKGGYGVRVGRSDSRSGVVVGRSGGGWKLGGVCR